MKFDRQLRSATEISWVVSYGGKTIARWRTAAILKIDISPYLGDKSSDFDEIVYTAADFERDERHVIKNKKIRTNSKFDRTYFSFCNGTFAIYFAANKECVKKRQNVLRYVDSAFPQLYF